MESRENLRELRVTDVFKVSEHTSLEEHLGQTDTEVLLGEDTLVDELGHDRLSTFLLVVITLSFLGSKDGITLNLNVCCCERWVAHRNLLRYLHKVGVESSVGETFTANTDTLKHTVTGQLIQHESGVDETTLFLLVGDDATNEVGVSLK